MKICMPVDQINGLESEIFANFRGAPALLVIDSDSRECVGIDAADGACSATPVVIDAIVCSGGIGRGMFNGLRSRGIRVFNTDAITVADALTELADGRLEEVNEVACCGGGEHGHEESHEHAHDHGDGGHACCGSSAGEGSGGCGCSH
jgi:predicted Fe-Mo cluster-binding NifX family protein